MFLRTMEYVNNVVKGIGERKHPSFLDWVHGSCFRNSDLWLNDRDFTVEAVHTVLVPCSKHCLLVKNESDCVWDQKEEIYQTTTTDETNTQHRPPTSIGNELMPNDDDGQLVYSINVLQNRLCWLQDEPPSGTMSSPVAEIVLAKTSTQNARDDRTWRCSLESSLWSNCVVIMFHVWQHNGPPTMLAGMTRHWRQSPVIYRFPTETMIPWFGRIRWGCVPSPPVLLFFCRVFVEPMANRVKPLVEDCTASRAGSTHYVIRHFDTEDLK